MFRVHPASTIAVLLALLVASVPSTASEPLEPGEIRVCGLVENVPGWPIEGAQVRAFVVTTSGVVDNLDHVDPADGSRPVFADTAADGRFELILRQNVIYRFVVLDPLGPHNVSRGGAIYQPYTREFTTAPSLSRAGACAGGVAGIPMQSPTNDGRVKLSTPNQGFIEARVFEGALAGNPPAGDVDVFLTTTLHGSDLDPASTGQRPYVHSFHARTGADGVARLACASTAARGVVPANDATLLFQRASHLDAQRTLPCVADAVSHESLLLWRRPVTVSVRLVNETGQDDSATGGASPETPAQPHTPGAGVEGARVDVALTPAGLRTLAPATDACGDGTRVAVAIDNASPYLCEGVSNGAGLVELRLPWADAPFTLRATVAGYDAKDFAVTIPQSVSDPRQQGPGVVTATVLLDRPTQSVVGKVTDVRGAGIAGASVTFSNDFGEHPLTTGADGTFSLSVPTGPYDVRITATGYNDRACSVNVAPGQGGVATLDAVSPFHCWSLASTGKVVVGSVLRDLVLDLPIPGIQVCIQGTSTCSPTRADGSVFLESSPGVEATLVATPGQGWDFTKVVSYDSAVDPKLETADAFRGTSPLTQALLREITPTTILFTDGANPLPGTITDVGGPASGGPLLVDAIAAADGTVVAETVWTSHPTLPQFNVGDYVVTADRHKAVKHYTLTASRNFAIVQGAAPQTVTVTMTEDGAVSTALILIDAHTGQTITTGTLEAQAMLATYVCGPTCSSPVGGSGLVLYADHVYRLCGKVPGYLDTQAEACKPSVPAGEATTIRLFRTRIQADVTVVDPHTGRAVEGLAIRLVNPTGSTFVCFPTGATGYCAATAAAPAAAASVPTNNVGRATIHVPRHTGAEMCFEVVAGTGRVLVPATVSTTTLPSGTYQESASFQKTTVCPGIASAPATQTLTIRPLRAAGATPLAGKVESAMGGSISGTRVMPTAERGVRPNQGDFVCNPAAHDTTGASFPDCAGKLVDPSTGAFSFVLPVGDLVSVGASGSARTNGVSHLWNVTASLAGHYDAHAKRAQPGSNVGTLMLWPRGFTATVVLSSPNIPCDAATARVTLVPAERAGPDDIRPEFQSTGAVANPDGTCTVTVPVPDWRGDVGASEAAPRPAGGSVFLVQAFETVRSGHNVTLLSPTAREARVTLTPAPPVRDAGTPTPYAIVGNVVDADNARTLNGRDVPALPVPAAIVTAEIQGAACPSGERIFQGVSGPDGAFVIHVSCVGTYAVRAQQAEQLYRPSQARTVVVSGDSVNGLVSRPQDVDQHFVTQMAEPLGLPRALYTLVVKTERVNTPTPSHRNGVEVDPVGLDVAHDPAKLKSGADAVPLSFVNVPWGVYQLEVIAPSGTVPLMPSHPLAYVGPGAPTYTVYVR